MSRLSTVVVQRFCKPKVGGSNPSAGTIFFENSAYSDAFACIVLLCSNNDRKLLTGDLTLPSLTCAGWFVTAEAAGRG